MRCGSGRRALTGGGGRAEPAVFGGWGARRFLVDIWGLAESLVPAYTNSSIFCEKLRSGDAGERDSVSGERGIFCKLNYITYSCKLNCLFYLYFLCCICPIVFVICFH